MVYQKLRIILQELDTNAFNIMLNELCTELEADNDTADFAKYFSDNYIKNTEYWAYCYRSGAGINTNMHLERMHKTLKYTYLKGKNVKRLDKGINAIMRLLRDKFIDRLIILNKGKVSTKLSLIRSRHKNASGLDTNLVIECEKGWNVPSSNLTDLYLIQENEKLCNCKLVCIECNVCIHKFMCSCIDSSIKYNMCKHIHLVCTYLNAKTATLSAPMEQGNINKLFITENNKFETIFLFSYVLNSFVTGKPLARCYTMLE